MATALLITRTDFSGRVELANNMQDVKINNRILEAEDFDLRELMGDAFYYWFVAGNMSTEPYSALLNGGSYVVNDITYTFDGIKPVLVYYATSRLIKQLDLHFTPDGVMSKRNEFSDHIEGKDLSWRANQYINQGLAYWKQCEKYLDNHKTLYPLWRPECGCEDDRGNKPSPKVIGLGVNNFEDYESRYYDRRRYF